LGDDATKLPPHLRIPTCIAYEPAFPTDMPLPWWWELEWVKQKAYAGAASPISMFIGRYCAGSRSTRTRVIVRPIRH
jgi:hypothetical protein